jgi:NADPH-dependent curcumin reductase CurA
MHGTNVNTALRRNRQIVLRERPVGDVRDDCFELLETEHEPITAGQVLVRNLWLSFDPAQRGWVNDVVSYTPPVAIGAPMRAYGVGQVVESAVDDYAPGELEYGTLNWQDYATITVAGSDLEPIPDGVGDPRLMLSLLGTTGLTAYFGMTKIAQVAIGDAVLVTAAAGATGSVAGQIARACGATTVVGTAGSPAKREWVCATAGFDACLDHYDDGIRRAIRAAAPAGFDIVFDNVGGALLDAAIMNTAAHARIALCGSISTGYRPERPAEGLFAYQLLTTRRVRMEGFLLTDFAADFGDARAALSRWHGDGSIVVEHDELEGLERAPEGLRRLFSGGNLGKQILRLAEPG